MQEIDYYNWLPEGPKVAVSPQSPRRGSIEGNVWLCFTIHSLEFKGGTKNFMWICCSNCTPDTVAFKCSRVIKMQAYHSQQCHCFGITSSLGLS